MGCGVGDPPNEKKKKNLHDRAGGLGESGACLHKIRPDHKANIIRI